MSSIKCQLKIIWKTKHLQILVFRTLHLYLQPDGPKRLKNTRFYLLDVGYIFPPEISAKFSNQALYEGLLLSRGRFNSNILGASIAMEI